MFANLDGHTICKYCNQGKHLVGELLSNLVHRNLHQEAHANHQICLVRG